MADALALDPRGLKRICTNCGTRFYDFNKRPIACPSCSTEFTGEIKVKTRRSRGAPVDDDTSAIENADDGIVDADALETAAPDMNDDMDDDLDTDDADALPDDDAALEDMDDLGDDDLEDEIVDADDDDSDK